VNWSFSFIQYQNVLMELDDNNRNVLKLFPFQLGGKKSLEIILNNNCKTNVLLLFDTAHGVWQVIINK